VGYLEQISPREKAIGMVSTDTKSHLKFAKIRENPMEWKKCQLTPI
jgi:hypothetical protein